MTLFSKLLFNFTPAGRCFATKAEFKTKVGLIGVPFNKGMKKAGWNGVEMAPNAIRSGGLIEEITSFNEHVDFKDYGNLKMDAMTVQTEEPQNMHHYNNGFQSTMHRLSEKICEIRNENRICVSLGGDHAIGVGEYIIF